MITMLFTAIVAWLVGWLIVKRTAAALAAAFLLFSLTARTISLAYIDLAGPVYAVELEGFVGGGASMPLFACSVLALLLPLAYFFRPSRLARLRAHAKRRATRRATTLVNLAFGVVCLFVLALYGDMIARGTIPLFSGIDRLDYNRNVAGPLHPLAFDFGFLFAGVIGCFFVTPRLRGGDFDFRFAALLVAFLLYYALTGNRFSAFYSFTSFFVLPLAALPALKTARALPPPPPNRPPWKAALCSRFALLLASAVAALLIVLLLINSVVNVRGYDDPAEQFRQRILIQPSQLWWTTWEGLKDRRDNALEETIEATFLNPLDPTRNTSIQTLMIKNLGDDRAAELINDGTQYNGGYPEILFELVGPWLALPVALAFGLVTAWLLRLTVESVCAGRLATGFVALYVFFGFSLLYIGGMLNFLLVWTFWAKCSALLVLLLIGRRPRRTRRKPRRTPSARPDPATSPA